MTGGPFRIAALAVLFAAVACEAFALGTAPEILLERRRRYETDYVWSDQHQVVRITSGASDGQPQIRTLELYERHYDDGRRRTLLVFQSPDRMKGTAVLSQEARDGVGERWLYLPRTKRARRVGGQVRDESVVGSDLTYRELDLMRRMLTWTERDARVVARGEAIVNGTPTYALELWPRAATDEIGRVLLWVGKDDLVMRQLELYGPDGALQKRIRQSEVRLEARVPVAARVDAEDPKAGTRSSFEVLEIGFDSGFADDVFSFADFDTHRR